MVSNLLDELSAAVTPQLLSAASAQLGESQSSVSKGLLAALPLLLGALTQKARDPSMLSRIMSLLTSRANSPDVLANPNAILTGEPSATGMTELAGNLLSSVLGGQTGAVTQALSDYAGVRSTSASSLMTLASGLVTAALGERVRRQGLNGTGLLSLLTDQRSDILKALPGSLASLAGLGTAVRDLGVSTAATAREAPREGGLGWLWAALAALVAAFIGWTLLSGRQAPQVAAPVSDAVSAAKDAANRAGQVAGDAAQRAGQAVSGAAQQAAQAVGDTARDWQATIAKLGPMTTRQLPTNVELNVPEHGVEMQVIAYLDDPSKQVDPAVWFNFDRLLFETGSATLRPESQEQLKSVAEILKAYPNVKMKIGGYTDNTGNPTVNLKLSQDRATNVMNALVALGVPADRLSAEGFGEQFPVADNSTAEGRQQNRRIAMRVTEK